MNHPSLIANTSSSSGDTVFNYVFGQLDLGGGFNLSRSAMITLVYIRFMVVKYIEICSRLHGPFLLRCKMVGAHVGRSRGLSCRSLITLGKTGVPSVRTLCSCEFGLRFFG